MSGKLKGSFLPFLSSNRVQFHVNLWTFVFCVIQNSTQPLELAFGQQTIVKGIISFTILLKLKFFWTWNYFPTAGERSRGSSTVLDKGHYLLAPCFLDYSGRWCFTGIPLEPCSPYATMPWLGSQLWNEGTTGMCIMTSPLYCFNLKMWTKFKLKFKLEVS